MTTIFHIRGRLPRLGGNNFYKKDKSSRAGSVRTLCGAAVTVYDVAWRDKAVAWNDKVPCSKCIKIWLEECSK